MSERQADRAGAGSVSRRRVLALMLCSVALPALRPSAAAAGALALPPCETTGGLRAGLSCAGRGTLLLMVEENDITEYAPIEVTLGAPVEWSPDPMARLGGMGRLAGVEGNFSGRSHITAPQQFLPWPQPDAASRVAIFAPDRRTPGAGAPCDDPAVWQVSVAGSPAKVQSVHRKTVPIKTARVSPRDYVSRRRHLVTLTLDAPVPAGETVRVTAQGLPPVEAVRNDRATSELVHVCQAGYPLAGAKKGYVGLWLGVDRLGQPASSDPLLADGGAWDLVEHATGAAVASGKLRLAKPGTQPHFDDLNFNGCDIWEADFSDVRREGQFRLRVAGIGSSQPFAITANPYAEVFRAAARWYFHQRSGCAITAPHGEGRLRPRNGHPEDGLTVWQTEVQLGRTSEGFRRKPDASEAMRGQPTGLQPGARENPLAWGGWHDAGDWDRRIQHMEPVYQMAHLVETLGAARSLQMNIPESGKVFADPAVAARRSADDRGDGVTVLPDLIHEALWGLSLWRRTQGPDGAIIGGVEYSQDGITGSVSWNPMQLAYAYAPEEWAAYRFAMAAAKLGHVIARTCGDAVLGAALIGEAERAWAWAEAQVDAGSAGEEPDAINQIARARMMAAASLYRATGRKDARRAFETLNVFAATQGEGVPDTPRASVAMVSMDYVRAGREGRAVEPAITTAILEWCRKRQHDPRIGADYGLHTTAAYSWGIGWVRFGPGSNWRASVLGLYPDPSPEDRAHITDAVLEGMWFGLGCNPSNCSFVQGFGVRDFADALAIDLVGRCPVPGQPSFGVAAGELRDFERRKIEGALYPEEQSQWPRYAQIFESGSVVICAEHGMRSNAMEWLYAAALANELLAQRCAADEETCAATTTKG